ncbi:MAG: thermonuclease family protein, partial [Cyanobacteria bacterium]|nr:thermonuclease family protein [Cyanobacteriota bacterium]
MFAFSAQADQVLYCHDGDTCRLVGPLGEYKVRLFGVDAPEIKQAYGEAARDFLNGFIQGKDVEARCKGRSYDRQTCDLFYQGQDVSA